MATKCPTCHSENPDTLKFCGECGTQLLPSERTHPQVTETLRMPLHELATGSTFAGRYQIIERLGEGGMGFLYKVFDTDIQEKVALKLLRPEIALEKETIERFSNELKLARKISHRNVCRMFDLGKSEGTTFITMEYVPGEDLKKLIRKSGQLSSGRALSVAKQVCEGLAEAHHLGVVHRDLKPQNIMVDEDGNARIMDFGIARSLRGKGITGAGVMIGTPEYMSPEQVEGKEADQRADIYSLGIILYELLTGRVPFEGDTPFSIVVKHKSETPRDPRELNAQIPADLGQLVLKCLEKDKAKRYQSAEELYADLEKVEQGLPTTERIVAKRKPFTSRQITVQFDLKKLLKPLLAVMAVVAVALAIWKWVPREAAVSVPTDKPSIAVLYFKNNTGDPKFDVWSTALSDSIITDLSQSKYVRVLSTDQLLSILRKLELLESSSYASEDLRRVAELGSVKHILLGSMSKAGEAFRIDFTVQDTQKGEAVTSDRVEGAGEDSIFSMVDELTKKVKENLRLTREQISSDTDTGIAGATTSSPQAFAYLSQAYRYNYLGEFRKSVELLEQAIILDPEFATAHMLLGIVYSHQGYILKGKEQTRRAFELSERLPERERYFIQSMHYSVSEATYPKAIEAFEKRLAIEPDKVNAARNLADLYINLEQWDKALEWDQVNISAGVEASFPYFNDAVAYSAKGLYDKAREVLEEYRRSHSDLSYIRQGLAYLFLAQGQIERAIQEADKAFALAPSDGVNFVLKGDILSLSGDPPGSEKEYRRLLESTETPDKLFGRTCLGLLYLGQGLFEKSLEEAKRGVLLSTEFGDRAMESSFLRRSAYAHIRAGKPNDALPELVRAKDAAFEAGSVTGQISSLFLIGLALIETNSTTEAQIAAEEIRKLVEGWINGKLMRFHYLLLGNIELKKGNHSKAIENLGKAITFLDYQRCRDIEDPYDEHALFYEPLALAYHKSGDLATAQKQYEKVTQLTTGRLAYGDIYAKSFYVLGKIHEQRSEPTLAAENYRKFLVIWKDADAGLPEVEDAKRRLAGLNK